MVRPVGTAVVSGCRATYAEVAFSGVPDGVEGVSFTQMSGDGSTLVGQATIPNPLPIAATFGYPIAVSATTGAVTLLERFGAYGYASVVTDDGSIIGGSLYCDESWDLNCTCNEPLDCTAPGGYGRFRWEGASDPVKYPFNQNLAAMSGSGNMVAYTTDDLEATRWVRSTDSYASEARLTSVGGMSGDGRVVHGELVSDSRIDAVWFVEKGNVVTPPYPATWRSAFITAIDDDGSAFAGYGITDDSERRRPYFSRDGDLQLIDVPTGFENVVPEALSADGNRLVGNRSSPGSSLSEAVIWDEAKGLRTLADELAARGLELPPDAVLPRVHWISDDGRIIVLDPIDLLPFARIELSD